MKLNVIGVPFNSAGTTGGVANAPARLREVGLIDALRATRRADGSDVRDVGDVDVGEPRPVRDPVSGLLTQQSLATTTASLCTAIIESIRAGTSPSSSAGTAPSCWGPSAVRRTRSEPPP